MIFRTVYFCVASCQSESASESSMTSSTEWFVALSTLVRLLATVSEQMGLQMCGSTNDMLYLVHLWAFSPEWVSSAHLMLCKAANLDVCMSPHKMRLASSLDRCRLASLTISAKWTFIQKICWFTHFCRLNVASRIYALFKKLTWILPVFSPV